MAYEPTTREPRRRGSAVLWWILGGIALLLLIGFLWARFVDVEAPGVDVVTVEDVLYNPEAYAGRVITVTGEIEQRPDPASFTLQERDELLGETLLVVSATGAPMTVEEGAAVAVTGTLRMFDRAEVEADIGYELREERFYEWEDRPVLLATDVSRLP